MNRKMKSRAIGAALSVSAFFVLSVWVFNVQQSAKSVEAAPIGTYEYVHAPPSYPTDPSQVVVWNATSGACPKGEESKYLLIVAPSPVSIDCRRMRFKGVFLIGATFKGGNIEKEAPSGRMLAGGHINNFTFDQGITVRPFVWVSNAYYNSKDWNSWWGDLFSIGTSPGATPDWSKGMDMYVEKLYVANGHYGWTGPPPEEDRDPHSDGIQFKFGMVHRVFIGNTDTAWNYQNWFLKGSEITGKIGDPQGEVHFDSVVMRPMAAATEAYPGDGWRHPVYLVVAPGDLPEGYKYYYAATLNNVYGVPWPGPGGANYANDYFTPDHVPGGAHTVSGNTLNLLNYTFPGRAGPMWTRQVVFTNTPPAVVDRAQVGLEVSIDTAEELVAIFSGSGTTGTTGTTGSTVGTVGTSGVTGGPAPIRQCYPQYTSASAIPSRYGAAFNLFNGGHEIILNTTCTDVGTAVDVTGGSAVGTQYVFKTGYRWNGTGWVAVTFTGTASAADPNWLIAPATVSIPKDQLGIYSGGTANFIAAYTCQVVASQMKCGCFDVACADASANRWQLQRFTKPATRAGTVTVGTVGTVGTTGTTGTGTTGDPNQVAMPIITPNGGYFPTSQSVTITDATAGAAIYYTLNGTDPTEASTLYTGAFTLVANTTVKARAYKTGMTPSLVATAIFTKGPIPTLVQGAFCNGNAMYNWLNASKAALFIDSGNPLQDSGNVRDWIMDRSGDTPMNFPRPANVRIALSAWVPSLKNFTYTEAANNVPAFRAEWVEIGRILQETGNGNAIIYSSETETDRKPWHPRAAEMAGGENSNWKRAWRNMVNAVRSNAPNVQFAFTPYTGDGAGPSNGYTNMNDWYVSGTDALGKPYMDMWGFTLYLNTNQSGCYFPSCTPTRADFEEHMAKVRMNPNVPWSTMQQILFARSKGLKLYNSELGLMLDRDADHPSHGGDQPVAIDILKKFVDDYRADVYANVWFDCNYADGNSVLDGTSNGFGVKSSPRVKELFGY